MAEAARDSLQMDFSAYYTAGEALSVGLSPYVTHVSTDPVIWDGQGRYRHSRFLYPPLVAEILSIVDLDSLPPGQGHVDGAVGSLRPCGRFPDRGSASNRGEGEMVGYRSHSGLLSSPRASGTRADRRLYSVRAYSRLFFELGAGADWANYVRRFARLRLSVEASLSLPPSLFS